MDSLSAFDDLYTAIEACLIYPDEVIDRLARAFYPALPAGTARKASVSLLHGRRNRFILLEKRSRKFPLGNSLLYISFLSVAFGRVRPGGRTLFFCF